MLELADSEAFYADCSGYQENVGAPQLYMNDLMSSNHNLAKI